MSKKQNNLLFGIFTDDEHVIAAIFNVDDKGNVYNLQPIDFFGTNGVNDADYSRLGFDHRGMPRSDIGNMTKGIVFPVHQGVAEYVQGYMNVLRRQIADGNNPFFYNEYMRQTSVERDPQSQERFEEFAAQGRVPVNCSHFIGRLMERAGIDLKLLDLPRGKSDVIGVGNVSGSVAKFLESEAPGAKIFNAGNGRKGFVFHHNINLPLTDYLNSMRVAKDEKVKRGLDSTNPTVAAFVLENSKSFSKPMPVRFYERFRDRETESYDPETMVDTAKRLPAKSALARCVSRSANTEHSEAGRA